MSLRYNGTCIVCSNPTPAKSQAWWDKTAKQVTCLKCRPADAVIVAESRADPGVLSVAARHTRASSPHPCAPFPPPPVIDTGVGGISAMKEYQRRVANHERKIESKWGNGRIGRFAKFMSDEPQSTTAWAKGAEGERELAHRLTSDLVGIAIVLHDRKVPKTRGNIDHLVIAPSGIWIIDAKNYTGKVELRNVGGWFSNDSRLYVNNRDHTKLVDGLGWQADAVRAMLTPIRFDEAPVHLSVCFTSSEWGLFAKPLVVKGVLITWAAKLIDTIREPGPFDASTIDLLARELSSKLPASH